MSFRIEPPSTRRRGGFDVRTRALLEIALNVYAVVSAVLVIRTLILVLGLSPSLWVCALLDRLTRPVTFPLEKIPGGSSEIISRLTLADATLLVGVVLVPLLLVARGRSPKQSHRL